MAFTPKLRRRILLLVVPLMLGLSLASISLFSRTSYFSDSQKVRPWARLYEEYLKGTPPSPTPTTPAFPALNSFGRIDDSRHVTFHAPLPTVQDWYLPPGATLVAPGEPLALSNGKRAHLLAIGVKYPSGPPQTPDGPRVFQTGLYHPGTLEPMAVSELPEECQRTVSRSLEPRQSNSSFYPLPEFFAVWDTSEVPEAEISKGELFDSRTHFQFNGSSGFSRSRPELRLQGVTMNRWHDGPFTLLLDVMEGREESGTIPLKVGEQLHLEKSGFAMQLTQAETIAHAGGGHSSGTRKFNGRNEWAIDVDLDRYHPERGPSQVFILSVVPPRNRRIVQYEVVLKSGATAEVRQYDAQPYCAVLVTEESLDEIAGIRVHVSYPEKRVAMSFPRFPGLPPENTGLSNLFDQQIPHFQPSTERERQIFIENAAQVKFSHELSVPERVHTPLDVEYTDVTLAELLTQHLESLEYQGRVMVDPKTHEVRPPKSNWEEWWRDLRSALSLP